MFFQQIRDWFRALSPEVLTKALNVGLIVVIGLLLVRLLAILTGRYIMRRFNPQRKMIARKIIIYTGFVIVAMAVLAELGVKLTALLGAAGIVGIAVGFASQTSVSNIVSGLFLISEKPFAVGDVIKIGGTTGIIQSIDLLSIKIRTFDNLFVRIPNEKILNSELTNVTRFPIRRMDIALTVGFREDLSRVHSILTDIASKNPFCLDEPQPVIQFTEFKENGIEVLFGMWFGKNDFLALKNSIMIDITRRLAAEGIELPAARRALRTDRDAGPFSVRIVRQEEPPPDARGGRRGRASPS